VLRLQGRRDRGDERRGGPAFVPTQSLIYRLPDRRQMAIQAPVPLGCDAPRLVRFAEDVQVEVQAGARAGRG